MVRNANQANQAKQSKSRDSSKLTFLEHLYELRKRLFWVVLTLVFTTSIGLEIKDQLIEVVMAPLNGQKLVYLTPGGGFSFIFTLSLYFGVLLTIPVITYQIYRFLQPMLETPSRKFVTIYIIISSTMAGAGASLAYFLAIPGSLGFLDGVAGKAIVASLTADSYLTFVTTYMVGLAALFQIPLLLFLFDHIKPIPPGKLAKSQRYGIVATTVFAGLITPSPDLLNYSIVLFPILIAYESGVAAVFIRRKYFRNKAHIGPKRAEPVGDLEPLPDAQHPLTTIIEEIAEDKAHEAEAEAQPKKEKLKDVVEVAEVAAPPELPPSVEVIPEQPPAAPAPQQQYYQQQIPVQYYDPATGQPVQVQYVQPEVYQQQLYAHQQQQLYQQQQMQIAQAQQAQAAALQQQTQVVHQAPESKRSIEGIRRVSQRYKTNVHVPVRDGSDQSSTANGQNSAESVDGLLTAEA